jgi:hypothetical protein
MGPVPRPGTKVAALDFLRERIFDMFSTRERRTVESAAEARQAEPGPSILALLIVSLGLASVTMVGIWTIFFHL